MLHRGRLIVVSGVAALTLLLLAVTPDAAQAHTYARWNYTGDVNCSGAVTSSDAQLILDTVAGIPYTVGPSCPYPANHFTTFVDPNFIVHHHSWGDNWRFGDTDCNLVLNSVDALRVQRFVAGIEVYNCSLANIATQVGWTPYDMDNGGHYVQYGWN